MELNGVFGIPVLFSLILSFGLTTSVAFSTYVLYATTTLENWTAPTVFARIILPTWIIFHLIKILLIVEASETTSYEAKRTGEIISKLLHTAALEEDIRNEINVFSLQLIQNPLHFKAWGFLRLNYSMVGGIIASVTTYLIIMIQMWADHES